MVTPEENISAKTPEQAAEEQPLLTVSYTVTLASYKKTLWHGTAVNVLKTIGLCIGLIALIFLGVCLYYSAADHVPFFEECSAVLKELAGTQWYYGPLFLAAALLVHCFISWQQFRMMKERVGKEQGLKQTISFYDHYVRGSGSGGYGSGHQDFDYRQISRVKIRKYDILMITKGKNALSVFREAISREQEQQILDILRTRCPQVRSL